MQLAFYIAKRYLFSKKSQNVINIISGISVTGVAVGTMALIVILSVFNGFDGLIKSLLNSFDPDVKITLKLGKTFDAETSEFKTVKMMKEVAYFCEIVEENALLEYGDKQYIATIKGVSNEFQKINGIDTMMVDGKFQLYNGKEYHAVLGNGVAYYLSVGLNLITPIKVWVPKRNEKVTFDAENAFNRKAIFPSGVFSIQQEYDIQYMIVPIEFARDLLEYQTEVTSIEIKLKDDVSKSKTINEIKSILGNRFNVKDRYQQHEMLYKIMQSEKWAIYLILSFILLIASFNVIGSLTMLIVDKKEDITTLRNIGADDSLIKRIFLFEGWFISLFGALIGLVLGLIICLIQIKFGVITFPAASSFVVSSYPVELKFLDFVYVLLTVGVIGFIAAWYPVNYISRRRFKNTK